MSVKADVWDKQYFVLFWIA